MLTQIQRSNPLLLLICLCAFAILNSCSKGGGAGDTPPPPPPTISFDAQVTILAAENNQVIRGFGCATAFTPPATTPLNAQEFERLFGQGNGQVGLSILRIRVGTNDSWRTTELNHSKEAIKYGARILACPWSPPARFKTNNNLIGGKLITDSSAAFAKYLNDFALYMQANGAPLYAISVQNEPDLSPSYEGCLWTGSEMRDFLRNHGNQITATKLMAGDLVNNNQSFISTILNDNGAVENLDILSTHIYGGGIIDNPLVRAKGKEIWMTEHLDTNITHAANLGTAIEIHNCFTKANFNAYIWWYGKRFYGPIGQDGLVTKRGFFMSQFARFIKDGAVRLGSMGNTRNELLVSAYRNDTKKVVVVINTGTTELKQKIIFSGATAGTFLPFITSQTNNADQGVQVTATANNFIYTIPPLSTVTFVEQ